MNDKLLPKNSPPRINVQFDPDTYAQIKMLAHKEGKTMSEVVRDWTEERLHGEINAQNIALITDIIRSQLSAVLQPSVDRLAALTAKTCVQSSAAAYLTAEALSKFVDESKRMDYEEAYEKARKKAVAYTKNKNSEEE